MAKCQEPVMEERGGLSFLEWKSFCGITTSTSKANPHEALRTGSRKLPTVDMGRW
jgi:hypothetical protein